MQGRRGSYAAKESLSWAQTSCRDADEGTLVPRTKKKKKEEEKEKEKKEEKEEEKENRKRRGKKAKRTLKKW